MLSGLITMHCCVCVQVADLLTHLRQVLLPVLLIVSAVVLARVL